MTATHLESIADEQDASWETNRPALDLARPRLVRQLAPRRGPVQCPACQAIVYSRRHRLCGVCSQPLPEDLLFSIPESRRIQRLLDAERARHREWLAQHAPQD